jgi:RNA polymerase sigma-70 factor (ECF subfamily)
METRAMPGADPSEAVGLFEAYRRDVYGWAFRLLGRHHDAQDAAQDVFLRWLAQSRRALPDHPRSWLRQVTINRAVDLLRARRMAEPVRAEVLTSTTGSAHDEVERQELRAAVGGALDRLTENQRNVLVAKVYDRLTFSQIAAELGLSVPTAKTHYLRALAGVRDALARQWGPERTEP